MEPAVPFELQLHPLQGGGQSALSLLSPVHVPGGGGGGGGGGGAIGGFVAFAIKASASKRSNVKILVFIISSLF
jgi:hypothetical protein